MNRVSLFIDAFYSLSEVLLFSAYKTFTSLFNFFLNILLMLLQIALYLNFLLRLFTVSIGKCNWFYIQHPSWTHLLVFLELLGFSTCKSCYLWTKISSLLPFHFKHFSFLFLAIALVMTSQCYVEHTRQKRLSLFLILKEKLPVFHNFWCWHDVNYRLYTYDLY